MTYRAQMSLELLITLGLVLAFTLPVVLLLFSLSQIGLETAARQQADAGAKTLADNINEVYAEGVGAKRTVFVNLPPTTNRVMIYNHEVTVVLDTPQGEYHAIAPYFATAEANDAAGGTTEALSVRGLVPLVLETDGENTVIVHGKK